eukprot:UN10437
MARLEALTTDQSVGIVKRNMAVQQLAQLKGEDSLPLQKAKLTQEAVVRKLAKATAVAAEQTAIAKAATAEAVKKCEDELAVVQQELEELKNAPSRPEGLLWMTDRDLLEKKRSLPQRMW